MHAQLIVADVKSQLFFSLGASGTAVINHDDRYFTAFKRQLSSLGLDTSSPTANTPPLRCACSTMRCMPKVRGCRPVFLYTGGF